MAQQVMHAQMGVEAGGSAELIKVGPVTFSLEYRILRGEEKEGVCIHVYGNDILREDRELLRFDCFKVALLYHYRNATAKKNERIFLDYTAEGDPLTWTLDKRKTRLPIMPLRCEAEDIARNVEQQEIDAAVTKVSAWAETMTRRRG